jgi:hypothetical protein|tara:strand:+ start:173307 stop:174080 length:774 start_codon:yes stop_codon:yes gene_type:complete
MIRKRNLYSRGISKNFRVSRSKVDLFIKCKKCFWLDRVKGLGMIQPPTFALNNAVDNLLKNEFDHYRSIKERHPIFIDNNLNYLPYSHPKLDEWRENFKGITYLDNELKLIFTGAIDDLWINLDTGKLIVVDYKATSRDGKIEISDNGWWPAYKRQIDFYSYLLLKNDLDLEPYGYFLYVNGIKNGNFEKKLNFDLNLIKYKYCLDWIPDKLKELSSILNAENMPSGSLDCDHCSYFEDRQKSYRTLDYGKNLDLFE